MFQKIELIEEPIFHKFLWNLISTALIHHPCWSTSRRLIIRGSSTGTGKKARMKPMGSASMSSSDYLEELGQKEDIFYRALSKTVVWKPGLRPV